VPPFGSAVVMSPETVAIFIVVGQQRARPALSSACRRGTPLRSGDDHYSRSLVVSRPCARQSGSLGCSARLWHAAAGDSPLVIVAGYRPTAGASVSGTLFNALNLCLLLRGLFDK